MSSRTKSQQKSNSNENGDKAKQLYYPDATQYENNCFLEIFDPIKKIFPNAIIQRNIRISLAEVPQKILEDYFASQWPNKKELANCHHRIGKTKFDNIEIDCLALVNEEPGKTEFELSTLDSPLKFRITPPCIIVSEFTIQPALTFYKLFVLEKICCAIKTLPHLFFTVQEMEGKSIKHFKIFPLLVTNHTVSCSLSQFQLNLFKLNELMQKEKKAGGFVLAQHPDEIKIEKNQQCKELIDPEDLEEYMNWQKKILCMHLYKKDIALQTIFEEFDSFRVSLKNIEQKQEQFGKMLENISEKQDQFEKKMLENNEKFKQEFKQEIFQMISELLKQK